MKTKLLILTLGAFLCANLFGQSTGYLVHSTAYEASRIVNPGPSMLVAVFGYNSGPAQFIQVHDSTTLPANTAVPIATFAVGAAGNFYLDVPMTGLNCANGIVICNSTTGPTKTIGAADCWFTAIFR